MNAQPNNYMDAAHYLGHRNSLKIGHNTYLERLDAETIGVRLHRTYIVRFSLEGTTRLDSGGWRTVTTKERMNRYLPAGHRIYQSAFNWYIDTPEGKQDFVDGLVLGTREVSA